MVALSWPAGWLSAWKRVDRFASATRSAATGAGGRLARPPPGPGSRVPLPCPARADACSRGAGSVVVLQARPRLFERQLRVSTDVDRQVVLVGHAVAAPHRTGPFDAAEHALEAFPRNAH